MSYREHIEDIVISIRRSLNIELSVAKAVVANHGPRLIDYGRDLDRLYAENERLKAIVDLIELKNERDALRAHVRELESK